MESLSLEELMLMFEPAENNCSDMQVVRDWTGPTLPACPHKRDAPVL